MLNSKQLAANLTNVLINPALALIFAVGLLVFVWGIIQFLWGLNSGDSTGQDEGKMHMLWGIIGMFIMVAAYSIIKLIDNSVGSNVVP